MILNDIPLSLYIHIPWCEHKCPYCDFNSHDNLSLFDEKKYVDALLADFYQDVELFLATQQGERQIESIFIGGGTPSLFSGEAFERLLEGIRTAVNISDIAEITLEANPGSAEQSRFEVYRQAGVNRLSIGTQSYHQKHLQRIGRIHSRDEAINAAYSARSAGFTNFNIDLMFALPEQSVAEAILDVETAISLNPSHLSCYQLTLEPNTEFHRHPPKMPETDKVWEIQTAIQEKLAMAKFDQYEVSAYSRDNKYCRHNLNYWQFGDYLGIGAGAHGKITSSDDNGNPAISRYWKHKHPKQYLNNIFAEKVGPEKAHTEKRFGGNSLVDAKQLPFEFMLNALRLKNGFSLDMFEQRTFINRHIINAILEQHQQQQWIHIQGDHIKPTKQGYQFIDNLLNDYLV